MDKVERAKAGDVTRLRPPFEDEHSIYLESTNRNKSSIGPDLYSAGGQAVLHRLVERADALLENFGPGVLDELDVDPAVRVIGLRGADGVFSAGADISEVFDCPGEPGTGLPRGGLLTAAGGRSRPGAQAHGCCLGRPVHGRGLEPRQPVAAPPGP